MTPPLSWCSFIVFFLGSGSGSWSYWEINFPVRYSVYKLMGTGINDSTRESSTKLGGKKKEVERTFKMSSFRRISAVESFLMILLELRRKKTSRKGLNSSWVKNIAEKVLFKKSLQWMKEIDYQKKNIWEAVKHTDKVRIIINQDELDWQRKLKEIQISFLVVLVQANKKRTMYN